MSYDSLGALNSYLKIVSKYEFDTKVHWKINQTSPSLDLIHEFGSMHRSVMKTEKNKTIIFTKIEVPFRKVPVSDIPKFNKFLTLLERESTLNIHGTKISDKNPA